MVRTDDYLKVTIPKGRGRFGYITKKDGKRIMLAMVSDKVSQVGVGVKLPKGETLIPVIGIELETPEQARAWANGFESLAKEMENERNEQVFDLVMEIINGTDE